MSGRGVCEEIGASSMLRLIHRDVVFTRMFADLRFELGVKSSAAKAELVLVVLRMLNS